MNKIKFLLPFLIFFGSCSTKDYYYDNGHMESNGLFLIHINFRKSNFNAEITGCENIMGSITWLSDDTLILESSFNSSALPISLRLNERDYKITISGLPTCLKDKYRYGIQYPNCIVDSVILLTENNRTKLSDTFFSSRNPYKNGKIQVFVPSDIICYPPYYDFKACFYEYKLPNVDEPTEYNLVWKNEIFQKTALKDTFLLEKNALINLNTHRIFLKQ